MGASGWSIRSQPFSSKLVVLPGDDLPQLILGEFESLVEKKRGIDLKLQHLRGFAAAVAAFALHGDAADL